MHLSQVTSRRIRGKQGFSKSRPCWKELTSAERQQSVTHPVIEVRLPSSCRKCCLRVPNCWSVQHGSTQQLPERPLQRDSSQNNDDKQKQWTSHEFVGDRELPKKTEADPLKTIEESLSPSSPHSDMWNIGFGTYNLSLTRQCHTCLTT